ncbi:MAG TPA: hypothetical protein VFG69_09360, partial [Nannocystaceae bacterium]|nr:hypothetical protein [Nannocystaceae bacterium]
MAQLDGNSPVGPSAAESSGTRTTRVTRLPPPPIAGLRSVARLRGAFDEGLPTLRLPTVPPARSGERNVAPRSGDTVIGRPMSPSAMLRSGPRVLAQPVLRLRMGGPIPFDPVEIEGGLKDLVEDDAEELDVDDLVDADAAVDDTLVGAIDPADTAVAPVDPGATLAGRVDPDDTLEAEALTDVAPDGSAHGVPLVAV